MAGQYKPNIQGGLRGPKTTYKFLDRLKQDGNPIVGFRMGYYSHKNLPEPIHCIYAVCRDGHQIAVHLGVEEINSEMKRYQEFYESWKLGIHCSPNKKHNSAPLIDSPIRKPIGSPPENLGRVIQMSVSPTKVGHSGELLYLLTETGSVWMWDVQNEIWGQILEGPPR